MTQPSPENSVPVEPAPGPPARTSTAALVSLILGLLALPLNILAGLPALLVGYRSLYAINASEGQLRGRGLAIAGMVLGLLGCLFGVAWGLWLVLTLAQAASARAECADNLRQIGQALEMYQDHHDKTYPPGTLPNPDLKPDERLSWLAGILPYVGRKGMSAQKWQSLVDSIHPKQGWQAPVHEIDRTSNVHTYLCPGCPRKDRRAGLTDYIGLAGEGDNAATLPRKAPKAGFFGYNRIVTAKEMEIRRSTTLIVTETTRDNGPWIAGGPPTVRGLDPEDTPLIGLDRPLGGCHFDYRGIAGLNTLWLDGSVRYVTSSTPPNQLVEQTLINRPFGE